MKILLSASNKHFNPITKQVIIRHSVGVLIELFSKVIEEMGDVTYISDVDTLKDQEFDLIISWPRNFNNLTKLNKYKKSICFLNIAEASFLKRQLHAEASRLGCKVSDCFAPLNYYHADLNFLIGGEAVEKQYLDVGVNKDKIVKLYYRHGFIPYKKRAKNRRPVFIHSATTLGLRKGFWHVLNDFEKANIDAELICMGKVQNERFWIDLAKKYDNHPKIKILGWIPNNTQKYVETIQGADFVVFPSFGEGAPGSVIEAMESGCLPITTEEAGISYHPVGLYTRGDISVWKKAFEMSSEEFSLKQEEMKEYVDKTYNNEVFIETVKSEIRKLCSI